MKNDRLWLGVCASILVATAQTASAQGFPSKPIKIIAPYAAGGAADLMARYLCEKLPQSLGQPCVVENRAGAAGMIGMDAMLRADPDGHTLAMMPNNLSIIPVLYAKVPYDTLKDVAPIALMSSTPIMIGVTEGFPAKTFGELIAMGKANPGKLDFTTCGPASPQHLAGEMLGSMAKMKWQHINYKGCGAAMADVLSGTVPVFISTYAHFAPQIKSGKLRGYAMLGAKRSQFAPDFPTVAELGYPEVDMDVWFGLVGSSKIPPQVLARLNAEVNKALALPDLRERLLSQQYEPLGGSSERFAKLIREDMDRYAKVIREANIKPD
ncbi:MAG: tripartite tricarboxylate transporter substrate binding protein [Betaproteobacteria bacterium]